MSEDKYQITFKTWNTVAQQYLEKYGLLDFYNESYDLFCSHLKDAASILEMGCGPALITKYISEHRVDIKIDAFDIAPAMIALSKQLLPEVNFFEFDSRNIHTLKKSYDGIVSGFCMPYLSMEDNIKLFKDVYHLLNKSGIFYFSFAEGDYAQSGFMKNANGDEVYVYFYSEADAQKLIDGNKFKVLYRNKIVVEPSNPAQRKQLIFVVQKTP